MSHQLNWYQEPLSSSQDSYCTCQILHMLTCLHHPRGWHHMQRLQIPCQLTWPEQNMYKCMLAASRSHWQSHMPACKS